MILSHLEKLTRRTWWTVGSQPAVDSASSSDEVMGWGPRAGYVFQKGFVEFFCEESDVTMIEKMIGEKGNGLVHYFAGNFKVRQFIVSLSFRLISLCFREIIVVMCLTTAEIQ